MPLENSSAGRPFPIRCCGGCTRSGFPNAEGIEGPRSRGPWGLRRYAGGGLLHAGRARRHPAKDVVKPGMPIVSTRQGYGHATVMITGDSNRLQAIIAAVRWTLCQPAARGQAAAHSGSPEEPSYWPCPVQGPMAPTTLRRWPSPPTMGLVMNTGTHTQAAGKDYDRPDPIPTQAFHEIVRSASSFPFHQRGALTTFAEARQRRGQVLPPSSCAVHGGPAGARRAERLHLSTSCSAIRRRVP